MTDEQHSDHSASEMHQDVRSPFREALGCERSLERHHPLSSVVVLHHGVAQTSDWNLAGALCRAAMAGVGS